MAHSLMIKKNIKTSNTHSQNVIITAQQIDNTVNGIPRYFMQVWIDRTEGDSHLWTPTIKGIRRNSKDGYNIQSYHIQDDIQWFAEEFEKAIKHVD